MKDRESAPAAPDAATTAAQSASTETFFRDALGVPVDEFLLNIFGRRAYGPHPSAARLQAADVAVMADIDYLMSHARFPGTDAQPIRDGRAQPERRTTDAGAGADPAYVYGQFAKGRSIRFLHVHQYLPRVAAFTAELATALGEATSANIYLTPAKGEGLDLHYDNHDVFVLQCVGSKRWRLYVDDYTNARERPTGSAYTFDPRRRSPRRRVDRDVDMTPGDVLYLPRGVMHEVAPPSSDSLHVTFGVRTLTVAGLLQRALRLATAEAEALRAPVPHAMRLHAAVDDQLAAELAELAAASSRRHLVAALKKYRSEIRRKARSAPAQHWFGSHQSGTDGLARLSAALADRVRRQRASLASAVPPEHPGLREHKRGSPPP